MLRKYLRQFIRCHKGTLNRIVHIIGFSLVGIGIFERSLLFVILGGGVQEIGHVYQYLKTRDPKDSPLYCLKPQSIFAFPLFILIVLYVILAR